MGMRRQRPINVSVTFRHMEATDAIKDYAREKLDKIRKYFPDPITAHVVLQAERGYQHVADVFITLHNGIILKGKEATEDMYSSIDLVMAKIERQVRRYKERIRDHKPHAGPTVTVRTSVLSAESMEPQAAPAQEPPAKKRERVPTPAPIGPQIIKSSKFFAKPMSVEEAVMQMNLLSNEFLAFMNSATMQVSVVYRRKDGNYGLIETGVAGGSTTETKVAGPS